MAPKATEMRAMILLQENTDKKSVLHKLIKHLWKLLWLYTAIINNAYDIAHTCGIAYAMRKNASLYIYTLSLNFSAFFSPNTALFLSYFAYHCEFKLWIKCISMRWNLSTISNMRTSHWEENRMPSLFHFHLNANFITYPNDIQKKNIFLSINTNIKVCFIQMTEKMVWFDFASFNDLNLVRWVQEKCVATMSMKVKLPWNLN